MPYLGIDNGVTGTLTIVDEKGALQLHRAMPVKTELSYTKEKQNISRIDVPALTDLLIAYLPPEPTTHCMIERPMINPIRFKASVSAARALEATLVVLEDLKIPYRYIDSREWQKKMLPNGLKGPELKSAAKDVARRIFPHVQTKDADSILIAEYARRHW